MERHIRPVICPECWTAQSTTANGVTILDHERILWTHGRTMDYEGPIAEGSERCPGSRTEIPAPRFTSV